MRTNRLYETNDGVVSIRLHYSNDDTNELQYITIYAGSNRTHISARYIEEVKDMLEDIRQGNPTAATALE